VKLVRTVLLATVGTALAAMLWREIPAITRYVRMERM
jgi:hypothetical protein